MDKYIIKGNAQQLAKVHLFHDIINHDDVTCYVLRVFAKLLVDEYDTIVLSLWKTLPENKHNYIDNDDLHEVLDTIETRFITPTMIEPQLLLLLLQHDGDIVPINYCDYDYHYKLKNMIEFHDMMYLVDIDLRCWSEHLVEPLNYRSLLDRALLGRSILANAKFLVTENM